MAIHLENFVSIRATYPPSSGRFQTRMEVAPPRDRTERDYRDLLSEANLNFFHREYNIALDNYKTLRQKILVQSHPEMPKAPGGGSVINIDWKAIDHRRLIELSRRTYLKTQPGDPVQLNLSDTRLIHAGEVAANPALAKIANIGLDAGILSKADIGSLRDTARQQVLEGHFDAAVKTYSLAVDSADKLGDVQMSAELLGESAAMRATYAQGPQRAAELKAAADAFDKAAQLHVTLGDTAAAAVMHTNRANVQAELTGQPAVVPPSASSVSVRLVSGMSIPLTTLVSPQAAAVTAQPVTHAGPAVGATAAAAVTARILQPQTTKTFLVSSNSAWLNAIQVVAQKTPTPTESRQVGLYAPQATKTFSLDTTKFETSLIANVYQPRIAAKTLDEIGFFEAVEVNFVSYFVHLYFFVIPVAIGDCYLAMGMYQNAIDEYQSVLSYPFLNLGIEAPYLWLKIGNAYLEWGNVLFRREQPQEAKKRYEQIIRTDLSVPNTSPLYQPAPFAAMTAMAGEVVKEMRNQPHGVVNPRVAQVIIQASMRLKYIANHLNFLGLSADYAPVFRFKYLQNAATYMADNASQAEKTFINFRSTAENQKLERLQFQNAVDVNSTALQIEQKRIEDAALEVDAATQTRQYAEMRKQHADDTVNEWNTKGKDLTSMNAALNWASNAANDQSITYTGVRYDGASHDFDGNVHDFFNTVGNRREWLNWELQRNRLARQQAEAGAEVGIAQTREQQAKVRYDIQQLSVTLAQKRLEGAQEVLEYSQDRMFNEDMWFQLAAHLQDLAQYYLDAAIYAAFIMERAYEIEFDRRLNRIRLDYGIGLDAQALLGGDLLKRDIDSFTLDYLQHAQKKNPVRAVISLRDQFPAEFNAFIDAGILPFRTDLEIFDRQFPGSYRRKIKKIELFVEGLIPAEGAVGILTNQGIVSEWRASGASWAKFTRTLSPERMLLSSYQFRRDVAVFQPSDEMLGLFENMGPQCNWTLELPRSANNLDYSAIDDVKFVIYFDADFNDSLRTFLKTFYSATGGRSTVLSARFQFPDQYFRLNTDRRIAFALNQSFFAYNYDALQLTSIGIRILPQSGPALSGASITVTRASDNSVVAGVTDASGTLKGDPTTMAPFAAWKNASPLDTFTVSFGNSVDVTKISDVQLFFSYAYTYRPDGTLPA